MSTVCKDHERTVSVGTLRNRIGGFPKWQPQPELLMQSPIPAPLHGVAPRNIMGKQWWDKTRREAYRSTQFHCLACGVSKWNAKYRQWLEGHEVYTINYLMGLMYYVRTVPLCHFCHSYIHNGRLQRLLDERQISHAKYAAIIQHGDGVLAKAGLVRPQPYSGPTIEWNDWRLVLFGKEYPPINLQP